ncbi:hypothetical protein FQR65_LT01108, partial [Abscondita terminalis]
TEQFTVLWVLFTMIVLGNSAVLVTLLVSKSRKSRMNFFIRQLAIADLSVGLINVSTDIVWRITISWYAGNILCKFIRFMQAVVTFSSTYVLVALSIDRYDAITHPMNFSGSWKRARILVVIAWLLSAVFALPTMFLFEEKPIEGLPQCWIDLKPWQWRVYMTLVALALFFVPAIIITACYTVIVWTIWSKSKLLIPIGHIPVRQSEDNISRSRSFREDLDTRRASSRGIIPRAKIKTVKMTFVIVFGATVILIILLVQWFYYFSFYFNYLAPFPGPCPIPLIGNYLNLGSEERYLPSMLNLFQMYGRVFRIMIGNQPRLILSDSKGVEFLLNSQSILSKPEEYSFFHSWLGKGLLTSSDNRWQVQRRALVSSFHFQIVEKYIPVFFKQCNTMIELLENKIDSDAFDIYPYIDHCTLDIIYESATGLELHAQRDPKSDYVTSVKTMWKILINRASSLLKMKYLFYRNFTDYNTQTISLSTMNSIVSQIINNRRLELFQCGEKPPSIEQLYLGKEKITFLDLLLWNRNDDAPFSNYTIREELDTFMFTGHRPVAAAVSFTLYMISKHKDIQNSVREELQTIFGRNADRIPSFQDLQKMVYLEMVIKETMRLYPPIPQFSRTLEKPVEFEGKLLPEGLAMVVFVTALHRQPEEFPNPELFDPERFTTELNNKRSPYSYAPFSAGPRNCIGHRFAMLEIKTLVSTVLRKFELLSCTFHSPELLGHIVLHSKNGLVLNLKKLDF